MIHKYSCRTVFLILIITSIPGQLRSQEINLTQLKINSNTFNDFAPFFRDSVLYFVSNRKSTIFINIFNQDNEHLYKLYKAPINSDGRTGRVMPVDLLPGQSLTIGPSTMSPEGDFLLATLNKTSTLRDAQSRETINQLGIYQLNRRDEGWGEPKPLPLIIEGYSVGQPSLSPDGESLFFVSDQPGGLGETDIYVSRRTESGWESPQNLGPAINTSGRELFPFFHPSGKLYFSSDGHGGYGGLDIFYSVYDGGWSEPVLLEAPVNSPFDDFSCFIMNDEITGFFASNRDGVDNIYRFDYEIEFCVSPSEVVEDVYCFTFFEDSGLDTDTIPLDYRWEFSDGGEGAGLEVDHCFPGPGRYEIFLHAIDSITGEFQYAVAEYVLNLEKTKQVYFVIPDTIQSGESVAITAELSGFEEVGDVEYFWELGDGDKRRGETIQHIFRTKGIYRVRCEAMWGDNKVCSYRMVLVK